jgi:hypothetical protein
MRSFTPEKPPRSGKAKEIWDWWISHRGSPPTYLLVFRPGRHQRAMGTAHYSIVDQRGIDYLIWDVDQSLCLSPDDADYDFRTGQRKLA